MDLSDPTRAVTPTLDGPVLAVLAPAGRAMTVSEVAARTVRGSEIGVRRSLARMVDQGIVRAIEVGRIQVYELNREHVAAPAAVLLADLRLELWKRLRETLGNWKIRPVYACAFGSAARREGGPESDIDVFLVHPPFPGEIRPRRRAVGERLRARAVDVTLPLATEADADRWQKQVDELRPLVQRWTGNTLQVVDVSAFEWADTTRESTDLYQEIERDAVVLVAVGHLAGTA